MKRHGLRNLSAALALCLLTAAVVPVFAEDIDTPAGLGAAVEPPVSEAMGAALEIGGGGLEAATDEAVLELVTVNEKPYAYAWTTGRCEVSGDDETGGTVCTLYKGEAVLATAWTDQAAAVAFNTPRGVVTGSVPMSALTFMTPSESDALLDALSEGGAVALYEDDVNWPLPMTTRDIPLAAADFTALSNSAKYTVQGKTISADMVGDYHDCWSWARALYDIIWGVKFDSTWEGRDDTGRNLIRNLSDEERLLTGENLKRFIEQSVPGCTLRICSCPRSCPNIDKDGCSSHQKHSLIVVDWDANGMVVMDNMTGSGSVKYTTRYYTWDGFATHWAKKYKMVKYIKWPYAPEYVRPGEAAPVTPVVPVLDEDEYTPSELESIRLSDTSFSLAVGQSRRLTATLLPAGAADEAILWTSDDSAVARVDGDGNVTGVGAGSATVTASTRDGLSASARVSVVQSGIQPRAIALNRKGTVTLTTGATLALQVAMSPAGASAALAWKSSNTRVAMVSDSGLVTAVGKGSCTIAVRTDNGRTAKLKIKVKNAASAPTKVTLNKSGTVKLALGQSLTLKATLKPGNAQTTLTWKSTDEGVATISENGVVTPVGAGTCTVGVITGNGKYDTVKIKVSDPMEVTKVRLNRKGTITLKPGRTVQLACAFQPAGASPQYMWKSTKSSVASISDSGLVTAHKPGTATVGVITQNGKYATVKIRVKK